MSTVADRRSPHPEIEGAAGEAQTAMEPQRGDWFHLLRTQQRPAPMKKSGTGLCCIWDLAD
jgi:hypothetical protein